MDWFRQLDERQQIGALMLGAKAAGQMLEHVGAMSDRNCAWVLEAITTLVSLDVEPHPVKIAAYLDGICEGTASRWAYVGTEWLAGCWQSVPDGLMPTLRELEREATQRSA